jgi:hypothetical protein
MPIFLASDPLATGGQIAAIIVLIFLVAFILIGLALALVLLLGMAWVREKIELIKRIRPVVNSVNTNVQAAIDGTLPAPRADENKIMRTAEEIPAYTHTLEQKVDQGSNRVAGTVIEFRARTMMAQTMLKAFFLPGLTNRPQKLLEAEGASFRSPGYRILMEEKASGDRTPSPGQEYESSVTAAELKGVPVEVAASPSPGAENAATP